MTNKTKIIKIEITEERKLIYYAVVAKDTDLDELHDECLGHGIDWQTYDKYADSDHNIEMTEVDKIPEDGDKNGWGWAFGEH